MHSPALHSMNTVGNQVMETHLHFSNFQLDELLCTPQLLTITLERDPSPLPRQGSEVSPEKEVDRLNVVKRGERASSLPRSQM